MPLRSLDECFYLTVGKTGHVHDLLVAIPVNGEQIRHAAFRRQHSELLTKFLQHHDLFLCKRRSGVRRFGESQTPLLPSEFIETDVSGDSLKPCPEVTGGCCLVIPFDLRKGAEEGFLHTIFGLAAILIKRISKHEHTPRIPHEEWGEAVAVPRVFKVVNQSIVVKIYHGCP